MIPGQPLTVVAYLPGADICIAQTSDGQLGRVKVDHLRWTPITELELEAAVVKYGYVRVPARPSAQPQDLPELLAQLRR